MPTDPAIAALERRVATLENSLRDVLQVVKVTGGSVQIASSGKLLLRTATGAQIELTGPTVNINNGALEIV